MATSQSSTGHAADLVRWAWLASAFVLFAWLSWRTWPDILVDFGNELYVPWRLTEGDVLYKDIAFTMGPLSQHYHALLFRLFGVSLTTLIVSNLLVLAAIVVMLHWLFRRCGTPGSATIGGLFFLAVFAFSQYTVIGNYNYVCPYRHEVTHGLALGLAELICLVRYGETRNCRWLRLAGFCLGLIFLTKTEMLLPATAAAGVALAAVSLNRSCGLPVDGVAREAGEVPMAAPRPKSKRGKPQSRPGDETGSAGHNRLKPIATDALALGLMAAVPISLAVLLLSIGLSIPGAMAAVLSNLRHSLDPALTVQSGFYRALAGFDDGFEYWLLRMVLSATVVMGLAGLGILIDDLLRRVTTSRLAVAAVGVAAVIAGTRWIRPEHWMALPAGLPLLLAPVVVISTLKAVRSRAPVALPLCLLTVYGLCLLPKVLLAVGWRHYGFALAMPGTLVLIHVVVHALPTWLNHRGGSGRYFRAMAVGMVLFCSYVHFAGWCSADAAKTLAVGWGGDLFYAEPNQDDRSRPTVAALTYLRGKMRPGETLCVMPEGSMLNYQLRKRNPTGILMVTPWELHAHGGEERLVESLTRSPPDFVVHVTMDMQVHGHGQFPNPEYGGRVFSFINANYKNVENFSTTREVIGPDGSPTRQVLFTAAVYQRTPARE